MSPSNIFVVGAFVGEGLKPAIPPPCKYSSPPVPAIDLFMFIFLGSLTPSVQNKKSSKTLIPVIIEFLLKFKILGATKNTSSLPLTVTALLKVIVHLLLPESYAISVTVTSSFILTLACVKVIPALTPVLFIVELPPSGILIVTELFAAVLAFVETLYISIKTYFELLFKVSYSNI